MTDRLPVHPLAELFPLIEGDDFLSLAEDIREHGVRDRIELLDGAILDGRNRYNVLVHLVESGEVLGEGWGHRAGEPLAPEHLQPDNAWFRKFNRHVDGDPLPWVLSKNLKRRHLDESQRAMVAAKLAKIGHGGDRRSDQAANLPLDNLGQKAAAQLLNVSQRSLRSAKTVHERGTGELQHAVEQGRVAVSTAETIASLPQDKQAELVAKGEKEILAAAKSIRSRQRVVRFNEVNQKLASISEASRPLPSGQRYPIIYADPATRYVSGFGDRSIENHYPTMTVEELCALPVGDLAMKDAVLFIWSTVPQLANTLMIINAWGFKYVSEWCWDKEIHGTGHWGFNQHEPLLIATRGDFPAPVPGTQPRSIYRETKGEHSAKPSWFAEQIERIWPDLPKIELFARSPRPGWAAWGNQSGDSPAIDIQSSDGGVEGHAAVPLEIPTQRSGESRDPLGDGSVKVGPHRDDAAGIKPGPSDESRAKADAEIAAMEGASAPAAEGIDGAAGRLASGRTLAAAENAAPFSAAPIPRAPPHLSDAALDIPAFLRRRPDNSLPDLKEPA